MSIPSSPFHHGLLAALERASLVAVIGFFAGGLLCTYLILPLLF